MPEPAPIQAPPDLVNSGSQPMIFTMPERYRGGAVGTAMTVPKPEAAPVVPPKPVPPPPPPKPVPPKAVPLPPHGKPQGKVAVLVGVVVLLALGVAGFFVLRATQAPAPTPIAVVTPPVTQPTPPVTQPTPPTTPTTPPANPFPATLHPGLDSDSDGLTDVEESVVYNTGIQLPDTDGDGFLDGNEVFSLYDPKMPSPATLSGDGITKPFSTSLVPGAPSLPYVVDYPSIWTTSAVATDPLGVSFAATTGETITLTVQQKSDATQTLAAWYAAQQLPATGRPFTTKGGLAGILSDDQLTAYVDAKGLVVTLKYDAGIKGTIDYLTTFKMMQNSLRIK